MSKPLKILVTGDTHLGDGRVKDLSLSESVDILFGDFLDKIREADLVITNLESPIIDEGEPIKKIGPNLKSSESAIKVLENAGFNLLTLANNHIMDYGENGLLSTLNECREGGVEIVGAGINLDKAKEPYICEINGIRISVINVAENEFGTTNGNTAGAHPLNPVQNYYSINDARDETDYVFVIIHGGHENYPLPSPRMKETYRFFVDAGADAVIGHHPHCYSGYEIYKDSPIFYSLGNFLFDKGNQSPDDWNIGYMVEFKVKKNSLDYELIPYVQNAEQPGLQSLAKEEHFEFENNLVRLNQIIADDKELKKNFETFIESSRNLYSSYIEPHALKYIHALRSRKLFPSLLSDRKKRLLLNLARCEAHRDVLLKILEK